VDRQYGGRTVPGLARQALHAWRLSFPHPASGERLTFEAPLPADLAAFRERLRSAQEPT
jgi:23S rRNA pseudouridine1911/1915/1917 synthase